MTLSATRSVAVGCARGEEPVEPAPEHHGDDVAVRQIRSRFGSHGFAIAQDRDAVGNAPHLVHAMRDVEHKLARSGALPRLAEQPVDFLGQQRRGRFVENEDGGVARQGLDDLDELAVRDRKRSHRHVRCDRGEAERGKERGGPLVEIALRDCAERRELFVAEEDVFGDGEVGDQGKFLKHRADARTAGLARIARAVGAARKPQLAFVGGDGARENLDEGGFPGAILTQNGTHFAGIRGEVHLVQGKDAAIALADPNSFQQCHDVDLLPGRLVTGVSRQYRPLRRR